MNRFTSKLSNLLCVLTCLVCIATLSQAHVTNAEGSPVLRAKALLAQMTLDEKIGQMTLVEKDSITPDAVQEFFIGGVLSGGGGYPKVENSAQAWAAMVDSYQRGALATRLQIPILYGVDAVHGHAAVYGATVFPHNIGLGATNDPALVERVARATAIEMAATGIYWNYAPVAAVVQDARWGRTYETFGSDTARVSALVAAAVNGYQTAEFGAPDTVLATVKHFIGDGGTQFGSSTYPDYLLDQGVTSGDEAALRRIHLPPYQAAISAGAQSIMVSFSSWGDPPRLPILKMHAQRYLITDVLKTELGLSGFVVSDWGGIDQIDPDYANAVVTSINAGVDMNMTPYDYRKFIGVMKQAVASGAIPQARIDDAVTRILTVKLAMGLFDHPYSSSSSDSAQVAQVGSTEHRALAREAVQKSLVLLKGDPVKPLSAITSGTTILIAGQGADDIGIQAGGWTLEWQGAQGAIIPGTTIRDAIMARAGSDANVLYSRLGRFNQLSGMSTAGRIGIVVVSEDPYAEGRGDRATLTLNDRDLATVKRVRQQVQTLILVVISGRPLDLGTAAADADSIVVAWLPGSEGTGVADVLFGNVPFSGKLPLAWPGIEIR